MESLGVRNTRGLCKRRRLAAVLGYSWEISVVGELCREEATSGMIANERVIKSTFEPDGVRELLELNLKPFRGTKGLEIVTTKMIVQHGVTGLSKDIELCYYSTSLRFLGVLERDMVAVDNKVVGS